MIHDHMKATEHYFIPLVSFVICYTAVPPFKSGWNCNDVTRKLHREDWY